MIMLWVDVFSKNSTLRETGFKIIDIWARKKSDTVEQAQMNKGMGTYTGNKQRWIFGLLPFVMREGANKTLLQPQRIAKTFLELTPQTDHKPTNWAHSHILRCTHLAEVIHLHSICSHLIWQLSGLLITSQVLLHVSKSACTIQSGILCVTKQSTSRFYTWPTFIFLLHK